MIKIKDLYNNPSKYKVYSISTIPNHNFLSIHNRKRSYYGSNQNWFHSQFARKKSCSTIAATNILAHMATTQPDLNSLYPYDNFSQDNFISFMDTVSTYIKPKHWGILTLSGFERGILNYTQSKDINLTSHKSGLFSSQKSTEEFIIGALNKNLPLAMLQYINKSGFNWHWVTITQFLIDLQSSDRYIIVSSWGKRYILDFESIFRNKMIYFDSN